MLRFGVLGPVTATGDGGPISLKGSRQRAVLARLLVAKGRVVPVNWLIEDLWPDAPEGALGAVQTFIGELRKALEPDRAPRAPSHVIVTAAPGYSLKAGPADVDAWRFEDAVVRSASLLAEGQSVAAKDLLDNALRLWRGPAYAEFAELDWARAEAGRLDELRLLAVERRAQALVDAGRAAEAAADLQGHVEDHPYREEGWRLLALSLYRCGRQADGLAAIRSARRVLAHGLGVELGIGLRQLEADMLDQATHLDVRTERGAAAPPPGQGVPPVVATSESFVGRVTERAAFAAIAEMVSALRQPALVLLSGSAGSGKTTLVDAVIDDLQHAGWAVGKGRSPELAGTPQIWPWQQLRDGATVSGSSRYSRQQAAAALIGGISENRSVAVVFDDLQWADEELLAMITELAQDLSCGPLMIVAAYRSTEIGDGLREMLARAARLEPHRVYLSGLSESETRELFRQMTFEPVDGMAARLVHQRSGGNPFFVRELVRLWETDPDALSMSVPAGVRDVIRQRLAHLPEITRGHLRMAAVVGELVDLDVLIALAGREDEVLDSVELGVLAGFLVESGGRLRFAHSLVRESLYSDVSAARRARWHAAVADLVEASDPQRVTEIAHHLMNAGDRVAPTRITHFGRLAAESAEREFALNDAAHLWSATLDGLRKSPTTDLRVEVAAMMGLARSSAVIGRLPASRRHRAEALTAAETLGDATLIGQVVGAFDVPAIWTSNDDETLSARLATAAERVLLGTPADQEMRARLLISIAMERRADAGPRGEAAAREAEILAHALGRPDLLAMALNGRFLQTFQRAGLASERASIGEELLKVTVEAGGLTTFEVLAHLILIQAGSAEADFPAADRHVVAVEELAARHHLPFVGIFTDWYAALRYVASGYFDKAEAAYLAATARMAGSGMPGLEAGISSLALLAAKLSQVVGVKVDKTAGTLFPPAAEAAKSWATMAEMDWGPYQPWARPVVLLGLGKLDEARQAAAVIPMSPRDLLLEARLCLHAVVAVEIGDVPTMESLYELLLPAAQELAGAGSGLLTLGPVASYLARLASALGRSVEAAEHVCQVQAILERLA